MQTVTQNASPRASQKISGTRCGCSPGKSLKISENLGETFFSFKMDAWKIPKTDRWTNLENSKKSLRMTSLWRPAEEPTQHDRLASTTPMTFRPRVIRCDVIICMVKSAMQSAPTTTHTSPDIQRICLCYMVLHACLMQFASRYNERARELLYGQKR